ncbi:MAG: ATP-binding protein, partial [Geminicoccaceae bacterium]|nr:ATP-binding protein [Geminicoccaceae bacterium]
RKTKPLSTGAKSAGEQLSAFLSALLKLVATTPRCALVFTLAVGKDLAATDAYAAEHEEVARVMEELASIAARNATILNPTREDETVAVLKRRLFERIDEAAAGPIVAAYGELWKRFADHLPPGCRSGEAAEALRASWPFHPDLVAVLTEKLASLGKFQRIRGMLRLLGRTIHRLWLERPHDAHAIHTHHLDLGFQPLRDELTIRLERPDMVPPLTADIATGEAGPTTDDGKQAGPGLARELDRRQFAGMAPYASYVARTIFLHSLAYPEDRAGIAPPELRFAVLSPSLDFEFVEQARQLFVHESSFLDDRPGAPYRFRTEPNLTQILRREEDRVDAGSLRDRLNGRIREIFDGRTLEFVPFPAGPFDVPDETSNRRPRLVLIGHEAATVDRLVPKIPELVLKIFRQRGSSGDFRRARNHLLFLVAEEQEVETIRTLVRRRLALESISGPTWAQQLPEYQRKQVEENKTRIEAETAIAVQKAYRHIFYPSRVRMEGAEEDLAHTVLEHPAAAAKPGDGQRMIVERLRELGKLRLPEDEPDSPAYVRDRTPLRKGAITTGKLRQEFFDDPSLPMLVGEDVFLKLLRKGVEQGEFVYRRGDLIWAKGLPAPGTIAIDEESELFTAAYARDQGIWPRPAPPPPPPPPPDGSTGGSGPRKLPEDGGGPPPPPEPETVEAEAPLREALARVFEQARGRGWKALAWLELRPFDPADAFTLAGLAGLVPKAAKRIRYEVAIESPGTSRLELAFDGPSEEEKPVRDFLRPQIEVARSKGREHDVACTIHLLFEGGLALAGTAAEELGERLARAGAAAAQVRASAGGAP